MRVEADGLGGWRERHMSLNKLARSTQGRENKGGEPLFWISLKAKLHEGVKVRGERPVVRMPRGGGGGLAVGVANAAGSRTLADAGVGPGARRLEGELFRGDGGGVQQTRHRPVQLLQQHLQVRREGGEFNGRGEIGRAHV